MGSGREKGAAPRSRRSSDHGAVPSSGSLGQILLATLVLTTALEPGARPASPVAKVAAIRTLDPGEEDQDSAGSAHSAKDTETSSGRRWCPPSAPADHTNASYLLPGCWPKK